MNVVVSARRTKAMGLTKPTFKRKRPAYVRSIGGPRVLYNISGPPIDVEGRAPLTLDFNNQPFSS